MDRKDWTLLIIASAGGRSLTPAQLQKSIFLLGQDHSEAVGEAFYEFVPYDYGPFSAEIYRDAEALESEDLVIIHRNAANGWNLYSASPEGAERSKELRADLGDEVVDYIDEKVAWARSQSFQQLIRTIYERFPKYKERSVFRIET